MTHSFPTRRSSDLETIGYSVQGGPFQVELCPADDGIRIMDLDTGAYRMLVSYGALKQFHHRASMDKAIHWVSHIEINPASSRILFLHRWTERVEDETCFLHRLITIRSEEPTSELQSLMRISSAVFS